MIARLGVALAWVMAVGAALFLLAPLVIIAAASFSPTPVFDLPTDSASLRWYARVGESLLPHPVEVAAPGVPPRDPTNSRPEGPGSANPATCTSTSVRNALGRLMGRLPASDFGSSSTCDPSSISAVA